ncbi:MAG: CsbD family protein [Pseudomonadota bacterium]
MNKDIFEGNWKMLKGEVQTRWGKLTDDVLDQVEGNREKLSGLIQKNYGLAKDAADREISEWEETSRRNRDNAA